MVAASDPNIFGSRQLLFKIILYSLALIYALAIIIFETAFLWRFCLNCGFELIVYKTTQLTENLEMLFGPCLLVILIFTTGSLCKPAKQDENG